VSPWEAIKSTPPNVWLTSFYGFSPSAWGFLGFSNDGQRKHFTRETEPGALVVIYGHKTLAPVNQRGMVIGIQQVSHRVNHAQHFMSPTEWARKESSTESAGRWNLAVKATRAWHVAQESYLPIEEFAPESYSTGRAQYIGSQGTRLSSTEAQRILDLTLIETSVFGEIPIEAAVAVPGRDLLAPSKPGPVSQSGYFCKESEGPKSLYILRLLGNETSFLGRDAHSKQIIKVGISASPSSRCAALNSAFPAGAYRWEIVRTNERDGRDLFPSSKPAISAETKIKEFLAREEESLGGEFFLTGETSMHQAWNLAFEGEA
tara:strand:+ start:1410 stop:2363 length:954 start_codon:yes stop_codon:yes gene_type:complete